MITVLKLAGLSAVLSAGVVTAYELPKATAPAQAKIYQNRILPDAPAPVAYADAGKAVGPTGGAADDGSVGPNCFAQAWPYVSQDCVSDAKGAPARKAVRTITIERREAANTSTLVRVPTAAFAAR